MTAWAVVERIEAGELAAAHFGTLTLVSRADIAQASLAVLGAVEGVARERGITLAELATVAGVDLESLTGAGLTKLAMTLTYWEQRLAEHLLRVMKSA